MSALGKVLILIGLIVTAVGLILGTGVGKGWLGRLPGDIHFTTRHASSIYFPVVTCLLLSLLLSMLIWLFRR